MRSDARGIELQTDTASASTIQSGQGGVSLQAGNTVFMQSVKVDAAKDITLSGRDVIIQGATGRSSVTGTSSARQRGITAGQFLWHDPSKGINARNTGCTFTALATVAQRSMRWRCQPPVAHLRSPVCGAGWRSGVDQTEPHIGRRSRCP